MYFFIYKRPNDTYYFKLKGLSYYMTHELGFTNQYGHKLILIISIPRAVRNHFTPLSILKFKVKRKIVYVLDLIIKKLD